MFEVRREWYISVDLLLGIGNDLLGDDGVGPFIAEELQDSDWLVMNAGIVPENFIRPIRERKPDHIVVVDAVHMGLSPGSIRIIPPEYIRDYGIGTHQLPLTFFIEQCAPHSHVTFIGIQPGCLDPDTPLTPLVSRAATELVSLLRTHRLSYLPVLGQEGEQEQD